MPIRRPGRANIFRLSRAGDAFLSRRIQVTIMKLRISIRCGQMCPLPPQIPLFSTLLDRLDIAGAVITADALHAQRDHATYLARRGAHYLLIVKRNQPGLHAPLAALPWHDVPKAYDKAERSHGRTERHHARRPSRPLQAIMNC